VVAISRWLRAVAETYEADYAIMLVTDPLLDFPVVHKHDGDVYVIYRVRGASP